MARKVFFSFSYGRDSWRAGKVRNCHQFEERGRGFNDGVDWEEVKRKDDVSIKRWINDQMKGTSVTVVLIGKESHKSKWIKYEIEQTIENGKGLMGIYINQITDRLGDTDSKGEDLLSKYGDYLTYGGDYHRIRDRIGDWVERAAKD